MNYREENLNPSGKKGANDCVVRAIAKALDKKWVDVYLDLCQIGSEKYSMPNSQKVYEEYLIENGFKKHPMPKTEDNKRYSINRFILDHPKGTFIISTRGHLTVVKDNTLYDTFNASYQYMFNYFTK